MSDEETFTSRSGSCEKEKTASAASRVIALSVYLLLPPKRAGLLYRTPVCLNPIHANMPRTYRCRSRIEVKASRTRRSISRKSPAPSGMSTFATRLISR